MSCQMKTLVVTLTDDQHQRLCALAQSRHTTINRLMDQMTTLMRAEFDAETRFKLRAARGTGRAAEGLALLDKVANAEPQDTGDSR